MLGCIQLYSSQAVMSARHRNVATSSSSCGGIFLPPSPPDSLPCSPRRGAGHRRLAPAARGRSTTHVVVAGDRPSSAVTCASAAPAADGDVDVPLTPVTRRPRLTHPGCTTIKYNRRTNPELERRRTHFCHFAGTTRTRFVSLTHTHTRTQPRCS